MSPWTKAKIFMWKWGVTIISAGMYEGTALVECEGCKAWYPADEDDEHFCIYMLPKEDDIN
jgi:hypothetical protein